VNIAIRDAQAAAAAAEPSLVEIPEASLVFAPAGAELGRGSYGVVRRATWAGTPVAVKSLQPGAAAAGDGPARALAREIKLLAALKHPNVVPVYGVCRLADGRVALVEELLTGGSLHDRLRAGGGGGGGGGGGARPAAAGFCVAELARVGLDVARGLAFSHSRGVSHNDLQSANVMFNAAGAAVLADFGLGRAARGAGALLSAAEGGAGVLGTLPYAAPENLGDEGGAHFGRPPGDVYSLGCLLLAMATGEEPWAGRTLGQIAAAVATRGERPRVPEAVDARVAALVRRCWAEDPLERPAAQALVGELAALLQEEGGGAPAAARAAHAPPAAAARPPPPAPPPAAPLLGRTCGDAGGRTAAGAPCGRLAAGKKCWDHTPAEERAEALRQQRAAMAAAAPQRRDRAAAEEELRRRRAREGGAAEGGAAATCGSVGGRTAAGKPCGRPAADGVRRCHDHAAGGGGGGGGGGGSPPPAAAPTTCGALGGLTSAQKPCARPSLDGQRCRDHVGAVERPPPKAAATCGEFGGTTANRKPCGRPAPGGNSRCADHK